MNPLVILVIVTALGCQATPGSADPAAPQPTRAAQVLSEDPPVGGGVLQDPQDPQDPQDGRRIDVIEQPREVRSPPPPGLERSPEDLPPVGRPLARDGAIADRFLAEGQFADYPFECEEGELSLFELATMGFARGWESAATIEIFAPDGRLAARASRDGGPVYWMYQAFVAPSGGEYVLRLSASRESYRYVLVRHSGYLARRPGDVLVIDDRSIVHGYLKDVDDRVTYAIPIGDEEVLSVQALPTTEPDRKRLRAQRTKRLEAQAAGIGDGDGDGGMMSSEARTMRAARAGARRPSPVLSHPNFAVSVVGRSIDAGGHSHFVQITNDDLTPDGQTTREVLIEVSAIEGLDGGLFQLLIERDPPRATVTGFVDTKDGDPAAGVTLTFFREPELDPVGAVTTSDDGSYRHALPVGAYTILVRDDAGHPAQLLHAGLAEDQEFNLIYP